ncbi:MAG: DUF6231 family protein [Betaproteobacteria bacterium]|nr:DUF6231 family protein [Betaproteobacteria bacterium]
MTWRDHLRARLLDIRPESICALDARADQMSRDVLPGTPVRAPDAPPGPPCTLALGIDALDGLDARQAQHLVSQTRLYVAPHMLIVAAPGCALDESAFRALGFALCATDSAENVRIYEYDLTTYKTVPDWLNSRFWAHPERWEP